MAAANGLIRYHATNHNPGAWPDETTNGDHARNHRAQWLGVVVSTPNRDRITGPSTIEWRGAATEVHRQAERGGLV
jgi:hypothetical protein